MLSLKRIYESPSPRDGYRVLVDRLWPRGVSKAAAHCDAWLKEIAPSDDLRHFFGHDPARWSTFRRRYLAELRSHREELRPLAARARRSRVTLLYAAHDEQHNNAVVLAQYLKMLGAPPRR